MFFWLGMSLKSLFRTRGLSSKDFVTVEGTEKLFCNFPTSIRLKEISTSTSEFG